MRHGFHGTHGRYGYFSQLMGRSVTTAHAQPLQVPPTVNCGRVRAHGGSASQRRGLNLMKAIGEGRLLIPFS